MMLPLPPADAMRRPQAETSAQSTGPGSRTAPRLPPARASASRSMPSEAPLTTTSEAPKAPDGAKLTACAGPAWLLSSTKGPCVTARRSHSSTAPSPEVVASCGDVGESAHASAWLPRLAWASSE